MNSFGEIASGVILRGLNQTIILKSNSRVLVNQLKLMVVGVALLHKCLNSDYLCGRNELNVAVSEANRSKRKQIRDYFKNKRQRI